jgi:hypothetical protein
MSMICKCDGSGLFPRCDRNGQGKCPKIQEVGYSTGKWSEDDDFGITPFLGPNR